MKETLVTLSLVLAVAASMLSPERAWSRETAVAGTLDSPPTFSEHVAPLLYRHCLDCHRAGEMAPMSLLTYREVRPWARAIARVVESGDMPPWHADDRYGPYLNARSLDQDEKTTLLEWVRGGAREGDRSLLPEPPAFSDGWSQGEPDVVLELPAPVEIQAGGDDEYHYLFVPTGFGEDVWVSSAEVRPGNKRIVHHSTVMVIPGSLIEEGPNGPTLKRVGSRSQHIERSGYVNRIRPDVAVIDDGCSVPGGGDFTGTTPMEGPQIAVYLPGKGPDQRPPGHAVKVPAGAYLMFQMHYSPIDEPASDRTRIGLVLAEPGEVEHQVKRVEIWNNLFAIPPGAERHEVTSCYTFPRDVSAISYTAHMHYRGSSMAVEAVFPNGERKPLFAVPNYSFNWQTTYVLREPHEIPAGTRIRTTATFDNSSNNPLNPDPSQTVRWGEPSADEMMGLWIEYVER